MFLYKSGFLAFGFRAFIFGLFYLRERGLSLQGTLHFFTLCIPVLSGVNAKPRELSAPHDASRLRSRPSGKASFAVKYFKSSGISRLGISRSSSISFKTVPASPELLTEKKEN